MYIRLREFFWGERAYLTYWYAFLLSFPFSWRKVFIPSVTGGSFNEYLDLSFYVGDILILSSLLLIIKHNYTIKSIIDKIKLFHVEQLPVAIFISYLLLTIFWSENTILWIDGILGLIRIFIILSIFVFSLKDKNCSTWNNLKYFIFIFSFIIFLQSVMGIAQFIQNHSLGAKFLGESILDQSMSGVAKIDFDFYKQIRAYGTFLHPNILGGYLVIGIIILFTFLKKDIKLFHVEQFWFYFVILLGFLALLLTFSKLAIVSLVLTLYIYMFHVEQKSIKKLFHVEQFIFIALTIGLLFVILILGKEQLGKSINERLFLWDINKPQGEEIFIGKGLGQSIYDISFNPLLEIWQLQPVHSVYFYIINEIGIIGFGLLALLLCKLYLNVLRGTFKYSIPLSVTLGTLATFDHYLVTTYVGQTLLALSLGWIITAPHLYIDKYNIILHNKN